MQSTKSGVLGILGLIFGVLVIFFVLNYFNILSLSQLYPNLFSSLPHKNLATPSPRMQNKLVITYPVNPEDLISVKEFEGKLLFFLKDNAKLYPAMDGVLGQGGGVYSKFGQNFELLTITNNQGQKLEYRYIGKLIDFPIKVTYSNPNPIAKIDTDKLKALENSSLMLTLYNKDGTIRRLSTNDLIPRK